MRLWKDDEIFPEGTVFVVCAPRWFGENRLRKNRPRGVCYIACLTVERLKAMITL